MRIKVTLAIGLAFTGITAFAVLLRSPLSTVAGNGAQVAARLGVLRRPATICQGGESLPREIAAIRLSLVATTGPKVIVTASSDEHVITRGAIGSGWYGSAVTVPVKPLRRSYADVTICARLGSLTGVVSVLGEPGGAAPPARDGLVVGRARVVYLRPGGRSWLSLAGSVIAHMALGRAAGGTWVAFALVALMAAAIALASRALTRELS